MSTQDIKDAVAKAITEITDAVDCLEDDDYMEAMEEIGSFCELCVETKDNELDKAARGG